MVHPQSVIHSLVEFRDHSTSAQLGAPDMRIPIAHALAWPERIATSCAPLDLVSIGRLDFEAPDEERFQAIQIGRTSCRERVCQHDEYSVVAVSLKKKINK